jgi:hypothetical protein
VYRASVAAPPGFTVQVNPSRLDVPAGATRAFTVTFTRTTAAFGQYAFGSLEWQDGVHAVHSQIAVRPVALRAPAQVNGTGTAGSAAVPVTPGFSGTLSTGVAGLVAASTNEATLTSPSGASFPTTNPQASAHTAKFTVSVPAGTTLARFATFDSDVPAGTDLDIFVYQGGTANLLGSSTGSTAQEQVNLNNPPAGSYDLYVDLFGIATGVTSQAATAFNWSLGTAAAGNLTVSPASTPTTLGVPLQLTAAWTGLSAGSRYLGRLSYSDGTTAVGSTVIQVNA